MTLIEFRQFPKIPRLSREIIITEKIDGTNGCVAVFEEKDLTGYTPFECPTVWVEMDSGRRLGILAGSRSRWLTASDDNHGFGAWVCANRHELVKLGPGRHFGEWWGAGINRAYGKRNDERYFSLFNVHRWSEEDLRPACCLSVPILYRGEFDQNAIDTALVTLRAKGSVACPGFKDPEGIIIYHTAANQIFKKTLKNDESRKGEGSDG